MTNRTFFSQTKRQRGWVKDMFIDHQPQIASEAVLQERGTNSHTRWYTIKITINTREGGLPIINNLRRNTASAVSEKVMEEIWQLVRNCSFYIKFYRYVTLRNWQIQLFCSRSQFFLNHACSIVVTLYLIPTALCHLGNWYYSTMLNQSTDY